MKRPIGIYEWAALTQEMLDTVRLRDLSDEFTACDSSYADAAQFWACLDDVLQDDLVKHIPDAIERGEKLLRGDDDPS